MQKMSNQAADARAEVDFRCMEDSCEGLLKFKLADVLKPDFQAVCPKCGKKYVLDVPLSDKLVRMLNLVQALRNAEDILGDSNVSVNVAGGSVKLPYALLLTRLNTLLTLEYMGRPVDFHLWIEPVSPDTFR